MTVFYALKGLYFDIFYEGNDQTITKNIDYKERKKVCIYHSDHLSTCSSQWTDFYMEIFNSLVICGNPSISTKSITYK